MEIIILYTTTVNLQEQNFNFQMFPFISLLLNANSRLLKVPSDLIKAKSDQKLLQKKALRWVSSSVMRYVEYNAYCFL